MSIQASLSNFSVCHAMADVKAPESASTLAVPGTLSQNGAISSPSSVSGLSLVDDKDAGSVFEKASRSDVEAEAEGEKLEPVVSSEHPTGLKLFFIVIAVICSIFLVRYPQPCDF